MLVYNGFFHSACSFRNVFFCILLFCALEVQGYTNTARQEAGARAQRYGAFGPWARLIRPKTQLPIRNLLTDWVVTIV